jgi:hypothetical protein
MNMTNRTMWSRRSELALIRSWMWNMKINEQSSNLWPRLRTKHEDQIHSSNAHPKSLCRYAQTRKTTRESQRRCPTRCSGLTARPRERQVNLTAPSASPCVATRTLLRPRRSASCVPSWPNRALCPDGEQSALSRRLTGSPDCLVPFTTATAAICYRRRCTTTTAVFFLGLDLPFLCRWLEGFRLVILGVRTAFRSKSNLVSLFFL